MACEILRQHVSVYREISVAGFQPDNIQAHLNDVSFVEKKKRTVYDHQNKKNMRESFFQMAIKKRIIIMLN